MPSQFLLDLFRTGDQHSGISWAPWLDPNRNRTARHSARRLDDLKNRVASPATQIEDLAFPGQDIEY